MSAPGIIDFSVRDLDGEPRVYRRDYAMTDWEAERLLAQFQASATIHDWWAPYAAKMAADLEAAMRTAAAKQLQHLEAVE